MKAKQLGIGPIKFLRLACLAMTVLATSCAVSPSNVSKPPTPESSPSSPPTPNKISISAKAKQIEAVFLQNKLVKEAELAGLPTEELRILRNVIFARHGKPYKDQPELRDYFDTCDWYKPDGARDDPATDWRAILTANDEKNKQTILQHEEIAKQSQRPPLPAKSGEIKMITEFTVDEQGVAYMICVKALTNYFGSSILTAGPAIDPPYLSTMEFTTGHVFLAYAFVPATYDPSDIERRLKEGVANLEEFHGGRRYQIYRSSVHIELMRHDHLLYQGPESRKLPDKYYDVAIIPVAMRIH